MTFYLSLIQNVISIPTDYDWSDGSMHSLSQTSLRLHGCCRLVTSHRELEPIVQLAPQHLKKYQKHEDIQSEESLSPPHPDIHQEAEEEKVYLYLSQLLGHLIIFNISYFDL